MSLLGRLLGRRPRGRRAPRSVFEFFDGTAARTADPVAVWYALDEASGAKWQDWLRLIAAEPPPPPPGVDVKATLGAVAALRESQRKATLDLVAAADRAFGVRGFDGSGGLTLVERVALVAAYLEYMGGLAGEAKSHPPTGSPPATA